MSRAYKVLDGRLDNVGERVVEDYSSTYSCCDTVGDRITTDLEDKLGLPMAIGLGFTKGKLTLPIGTTSIANDSAVEDVIREIQYLGVWIDSSFKNYAPLEYHEETSYLKNNKKNLIITDYDTNYDKRQEARKVSNGYGVQVLARFANLDVSNAFHSNKPHEALFGLKPSKFLSRYVEPLIEGITERYALALSERHTLDVMLTIDPNIMINCTESGRFCSCFGYDGEYHYSAQRYANSTDSAMAVVFDEEGYIVYRNWVMINPDRTIVLTLEGYSSIRGTAIRDAVKKVTRDFVLGDTYEPYEESIRIADSDSSYIDSFETYAAIDVTQWSSEHRNPRLGTAYDIESGCTTYDAQVYGYYCECCDNRVSEDETTYVEGHGSICDYCRDEYFVWIEGHDEYYHEDEIICNINCEPYHRDDIADHHIEYNSDWYPMDDCAEAYDQEDYYPTDVLTYSEELDRYYYSYDRLQEDLEELREAEEV